MKSPGKGYRWLKVGEVLRTGDQWFCGRFRRRGSWTDTNCAGHLLQRSGVYRRKRPVPKSHQPRRHTRVTVPLKKSATRRP